MRGRSLILCCLIASVALAALTPPARAKAEAGVDPLVPVLERFRAEEADRRSRTWYEKGAAIDALHALFRSPSPPATPEEAARRLGEALGADPSAGRDLLAATLCSSAVGEEDWQASPDHELSHEDLRPCAREVLTALKVAPSLPAARELVSRYFKFFGSKLTDGPENLAAAVSSLPDPGPAALDLAPDLPGPIHARLLEVALESLGPHPAVLFEAVAQTRDPAVRAAVFETAWGRLESRAARGLEPATPEVERLVAGRWLWELLDIGLDDEARAALAELPAAIRSALAAPPPAAHKGKVEVTLDGLPLRGPALDLRLPLAALEATANDPAASDRARKILASFPADARRSVAEDDLRQPVTTLETGAPHQSAALGWQLLDRLVGDPQDGDLFGPLTEVVVLAEFNHEGPDPLATGSFREAMAELAARDGYSEIAAYEFDLEHRRLAADLDTGPGSGAREAGGVTVDARTQDGVPTLPPKVEARARELAGAIEATSARVATLQAALGGGSSGDSKDACGEVVDRLLSADRIPLFVAKPLPPGVEPVAAGGAEDEGDGSPDLPAGLELPAGFRVVRAEVQGREAVAIGVSQDYDPVGEVTAGAYWVIRSHDGGKRWGAPLYTGLRVSFPYVVRPGSNLPMLDGDSLRLEVDVRAIDKDSIVFPPVSVRYSRQESGLYLEARWADLERDGDGDGLTDVAEERLVTDPANPDTDGDGLPDGADPMPQVPASPPDSGAAARRLPALAAAFGRIFGDWGQGILPHRGPHGEALLDFSPDHPTLTEQRTLFLVARRGQLRGVQPAHRVVVLTPSELERYRAKFGLTLASRIALLTFDRSGRRGFVVWDAGWQGGTFRLERRDDGSWNVLPLSSWIT